MFGGVNKHLFRKVNLIIRAQFVLCRLHNSDSLKLYESFRRQTLIYYSFFLNADPPTTRDNKAAKTKLILHIPYETKQVFVNTTNISNDMNFVQKASNSRFS